MLTCLCQLERDGARYLGGWSHTSGMKRGEKSKSPRLKIKDLKYRCQYSIHQTVTRHTGHESHDCSYLTSLKKAIVVSHAELTVESTVIQ